MNLTLIILPVSFLWMASEIILAIVKRADAGASKGQDRASLRILWITITISVVLGINIGMRHIGLISSAGYLISLVGLILIVIGLIFRWVAVLTLKRYFTVNVAIVDDHKIIDMGIYRKIRHPAYCGSLISFLGLGLSFSNYLTPLIIFIPIFFAFRYRMKIEEAALLNAFGEKYQSYMQKTNRLVPGVY
jgi:protein-S-isoprenylcysteine O-methyltransferase Ste14